MIYSCKNCEYKTGASKGDLNRHQQIRHEGIVFDCEYCTYKGTRQISGNRQIASKHKNVSLPLKYNPVIGVTLKLSRGMKYSITKTLYTMEKSTAAMSVITKQKNRTK